jgi:hypothetical protein
MLDSYFPFCHPLESIEGNNALRSRLLDIRDVMSELRTVAVLGFIIDPLRLVEKHRNSQSAAGRGIRCILSFYRRAEL